jgi:hypothetical protein
VKAATRLRFSESVDKRFLLRVCWGSSAGLFPLLDEFVNLGNLLNRTETIVVAITVILCLVEEEVRVAIAQLARETLSESHRILIDSEVVDLLVDVVFFGIELFEGLFWIHPVLVKLPSREPNPRVDAVLLEPSDQLSLVHGRVRRRD